MNDRCQTCGQQLPKPGRIICDDCAVFNNQLADFERQIERGRLGLVAWILALVAAVCVMIYDAWFRLY